MFLLEKYAGGTHSTEFFVMPLQFGSYCSVEKNASELQCFVMKIMQVDLIYFVMKIHRLNFTVFCYVFTFTAWT